MQQESYAVASQQEKLVHEKNVVIDLKIKEQQEITADDKEFHFNTDESAKIIDA